MGTAIYLNVDGKQVLSTDVTYQDLIWLYTDFNRKMADFLKLVKDLLRIIYHNKE